MRPNQNASCYAPKLFSNPQNVTQNVVMIPNFPKILNVSGSILGKLWNDLYNFSMWGNFYFWVFSTLYFSYRLRFLVGHLEFSHCVFSVFLALFLVCWGDDITELFGSSSDWLAVRTGVIVVCPFVFFCFQPSCLSCHPTQCWLPKCDPLKTDLMM